MDTRFSKRGGRSSRKLSTGISKQMVRSMIEAKKETKACTFSSAFTNTVAGTVIDMTQQIVQGDNINQRSGDVIYPKSMDVNLSIVAIGSTLAQSFHRVIIFQDMFNTGVLPTVAQVLDGGVYNSTYTLLTRQQRRFKILHDKMYGIAVGSNSAATHVQLKLKLRGAVKYNGTSSATASNGPGSIWFLTLTDSVGTLSCAIGYYANAFYTDA